MLTILSLDDSTNFLAQQDLEAGPVTVINTFFVPEGKADEFLAAWKSDAAYMKGTGKVIAVQLYRGIGDSRLFTNVAVWPSSADLRSAFQSPEFTKRREEFADGTLSYPALYQKIAVEGICEGE